LIAAVTPTWSSARRAIAFRADCSVKLASGQQLISHGAGGDAHAAFDAALAKIETRIRRYKRRLKSHSIAATAKQAENAAMYVLRAPDIDDHEDDDWGGDEAHPPARPRR
jgi:ribosome-associated translation inhibitor RaiA